MPSVAVAHEDHIWVTGSGQPGVRRAALDPRDAESLGQLVAGLDRTARGHCPALISASTTRATWRYRGTPVPHAKCEQIRLGRRLTIEATVPL
jgi:hypothetical protein